MVSALATTKMFVCAIVQNISCTNESAASARQSRARTARTVWWSLPQSKQDFISEDAGSEGTLVAGLQPTRLRLPGRPGWRHVRRRCLLTAYSATEIALKIIATVHQHLAQLSDCWIECDILRLDKAAQWALDCLWRLLTGWATNRMRREADYIFFPGIFSRSAL